MKNPTAMRPHAVVSNMDGLDTAPMSISEAGMEIVMGLLTNVYTDNSLAVVREYSCNARDSHVEAGQTRPIEVRLPSALSPQFQVQDWGVGLSRQEIVEIYAMYGESTKRNSNALIGALGIGAKSAFTVTNQFTVTGVKDGEKTIAMFALDRNGSPQRSILFNGPTDEPNGVLVDVAVDNITAIRTAAAQLFPHWQPGTVLVDGLPPASIWDTAEELAHGVYIDATTPVDQYNTASHFKLLMGGVPYGIPTALLNELSAGTRNFFNAARGTQVTYIFNVPIGAVEIAPNREELRVTKRTVSTVQRVFDVAEGSLNGWMSKKIDEAENLWEASRVFLNLANKLNYKPDPREVYWRSISLGPSTITFDLPTVALSPSNSRYNTDFHRRWKVSVSDQWFANMDATNMKNVLFVTNVPERRVSLLRAYAKHNALDDGYRYIVGLPGDKIKQDWFIAGKTTITNFPTMEFSEYWERGKAARKARGGGGGSTSKTEYSTYMKGDAHGVEHRTINDIVDLDPKVVLYYQGRLHHFRTDPSNPVHKEILDDHDAIFVGLTQKQSEAVFLRAFPDAKRADAYVKALAQEKIDALTANDHRILKASAAGKEANLAGIKFVRQNQAAITNAALIKAVDEYEAAMTLTTAEQNRANVIRSLYNTANVSVPYQDETDSKDFFWNKLPLLHTTLANIWHAQRSLGASKLNAALIDYVNVTVV